MELNEAISPKVLDKREVEVVILEEGPGNKARKCWYGREAIESGPPVFRGAQVFANHPSKTQMVDLPERDVRELVARIKECWVARAPTGKMQLRGIMKVMEGSQYDWVLSLMHESIKAQKEGFPPVAQVSIHADGDVEKRMIESEQYNYVKNIKSAVSVDLVTKGGIKGAGFEKFVESKNGGNSMTNEERLAMIQKKMQDAINAEDAAFLESLEQEDANLREDDGEDEYEVVYATADGFVTAAGEPVADADVFAVDEEENVYGPEDLEALAADAEAGAFEDEEAEDDVEPEYEADEYDEQPARRARAQEEDEVPISELATRFPYLANDIDREEAGQMESDRDIDVVNLKFENKLLKSRMVAEQKILESGLPAGFIAVDDLLGRSPEDMDRVIESRALMVENIVNLVESQAPANPPANQVRETPDYAPGVGRRILESSVLPY
jgi:hypothetical protein